MALPHDAVGWSAVCDCGISLAFLVLNVVSCFVIISLGKRERESRLSFDVMCLLVFCVSSLRCHGLVCIV